MLLITLDTTRADRLGSYGYMLAETPALDLLAAQGVRYSRAYASQPMTIPSHATIMTGRLPPSHGVRDNGDTLLGPDELTLAERLRAEGYATAAFTAAFPTQARWGFGQGFDLYHDPLLRLPTELDWRDERRADEVVDDAIETLVTLREGDRPVFAWVHLFDAHWPYDPPEPFRGRHPGRAYDGELAFLDSQVGRLLGAWDQAWPDSVVVVTADHGEGLGDGGELTHGFLLHDGTLRVPLLLRATGSAGVTLSGVPSVVHSPVSHADIVPTVLAMAGLSDAAQGPPLHGRDLRQGGSGEAYSETLTGLHSLGLAALVARTGPEGRTTRGAWEGFYPAHGELVDVVSAGPPTEDQVQSLDALVDRLAPGQAPEAALDPEALQRLQALGYMGGGAGPSGDATIDPRDVIDIIPDTWQARQLLAEGRLDTAQAALHRLEERLPGTWGTRMLAADLALARGEADLAAEELVGLYLEAPSSSVALKLARVAEGRADPGEAMSWYEDALGLQPLSPEALGGRVRVAVDGGDLFLAEALADEALAAYPDHAEVRLARARVLGARGELEVAAVEAEAALEALPTSPHAWRVAADCQWALGNADAAIERLQEGLLLAPWQSALRATLVDRLLQVGRRAEATRIARPLLRALPDDPDVQVLAARIDASRSPSPPATEVTP